MNVFELFAKLALDSSEYDEGLDSAKKKAGGIGSALASAAKVGAAALAAAGAAAGALVKSAVENYADYEQLVGGVETLFKDSADKVQEYAANAYKTAGLSANEYMETVTSFSASLLQSLGGDTEKAADIGNMAISDMADNANKMGTTMEAIQNAYQGFAKQNYTMLDNLKLGYGGTKSEMERLLEDATKLSGVEYDIDSLSDVYEAIHVIQEELGITGTTAKEASETISGSLSAMKSAWKNLITGIASENVDFDELVNNFAESAKTALKNVVPRIEEALKGVGNLVEELAPVIADSLPSMIKETVPSLVKAAASIVQALVDALGNEDSIDALADAAIDIVLILAKAIADNVEKIIDAVVKIITTIAEALTDPDTLEKLIKSAIAIIAAIGKGILNAIPDLLKAVGKILENILYAIGKWEYSLWQKIKEIFDKIADKIKGFASKIGDIFFNIGREIVNGVWRGIKSVWDWLVEKWNKLWDNLTLDVKKLLGIHSPSKVFADIGKNMALGVGEGWEKAFSDVDKEINKSFDFGEQTIDFAANMSGTAGSFGTKNGGAELSDFGGGGFGVGEQTINVDFTLRLDDGTILQKFAHKLHPYMQDDSALRGGALA